MAIIKISSTSYAVAQYRRAKGKTAAIRSAGRATASFLLVPTQPSISNTAITLIAATKTGQATVWEKRHSGAVINIINIAVITLVRMESPSDNYLCHHTPP
jgi:hypothetical protein